MANLSISSFPSDLPCTSSEHIYFSGKVPRSYREKTGRWAVEDSAARNEQFSAIDYEYQPEDLPASDFYTNSAASSTVSEKRVAEIEKSNDTTASIVPEDQEGTVIRHTAFGCSALDPLSSFATDQVDVAHPPALRQATGCFSLHNEKLVKAITDAAGSNNLNWDHIQSLNISGQGLTTLHGLNNYCPSLWSLNVDDNKLENLDGVPSTLRVLSANNNRLSSFTSWSHLPNLNRVYATDNRLRHLDGMIDLYHLTELDVSRNRINNIFGLAYLTELRKLNVSDNFLERVPWSKWLLTRLVELDMSKNMLYTIDTLDALPRLEVLNLGKNEINDFSSDARCDHTCLRKINLDKNSIMSFDFSMFPVLQDLNLDENLIMSAASLRGISSARSLIKLSLRKQQESVQEHENDLLETMMSTRGYFQELYLSQNKTKDINGTFAMPLNFKHRNIRVLEMAACSITQLPKYFGQYFPACHKLNLNYNLIPDVSELQGLAEVEDLLLAHNTLTNPKLVAQLRLPELRCLELRENIYNKSWYSTLRGDQAEPARDYPPGSETPGKYELPGRVDDMNSRWFKFLPSPVQAKRLLVNLLFGLNFPKLNEFDGASWCGKQFVNEKKIILRLAEKHGMARKAS